MSIVLHLQRTDRWVFFQFEKGYKWQDIAEYLLQNTEIQSMEIGIYFEDVNYYTENLNELIDFKIQNFNSENIFQILEGPQKNKYKIHNIEEPIHQDLTIHLMGEVQEQLIESSSMKISELINKIENLHRMNNIELLIQRDGIYIDLNSAEYLNQTLQQVQLSENQILKVFKQDQSKLHRKQQLFQDEQSPKREQKSLNISIHDGMYTKMMNLTCDFVKTTIHDLCYEVEQYLQLSSHYAQAEIYINGIIQNHRKYTLEELNLDQNTQIQSKIRYSGGYITYSKPTQRMDFIFMQLRWKYQYLGILSVTLKHKYKKTIISQRLQYLSNKQIVHNNNKQ